MSDQFWLGVAGLITSSVIAFCTYIYFEIQDLKSKLTVTKEQAVDLEIEKNISVLTDDERDALLSQDLSRKPRKPDHNPGDPKT